MRLPRLRLRTLLIAVAIAGLAIGGWQMWKRRVYCLEQAGDLERHRTSLLETLKYWEVSAAQARVKVEELRAVRAIEVRYGGSNKYAELNLKVLDRRLREQESEAAESGQHAHSIRETTEIWARRIQRYRHVARYPWQPLPPEPPPSPPRRKPVGDL